VPACECVIMVRKTESFALFCQQFGRALRVMVGAELAGRVGRPHGRTAVGRISRRAPRRGAHYRPRRQRHTPRPARRAARMDADRPRAAQQDGKRRDPADDVPQPERATGGCQYSAYPRFLKTCPYCGFYPEPAERTAPPSGRRLARTGPRRPGRAARGGRPQHGAPRIPWPDPLANAGCKNNGRTAKPPSVTCVIRWPFGPASCGTRATRTARRTVSCFTFLRRRRLTAQAYNEKDATRTARAHTSRPRQTGSHRSMSVLHQWAALYVGFKWGIERWAKRSHDLQTMLGMHAARRRRRAGVLRSRRRGRNRPSAWRRRKRASLVAQQRGRAVPEGQ
jgi:hypothetical protein